MEMSNSLGRILHQNEGTFWEGHGYPPNLQVSLGVDGFWGILR